MADDTGAWVDNMAKKAGVDFEDMPPGAREQAIFTQMMKDGGTAAEAYTSAMKEAAEARKRAASRN